MRHKKRQQNALFSNLSLKLRLDNKRDECYFTAGMESKGRYPKENADKCS